MPILDSNRLDLVPNGGNGETKICVTGKVGRGWRLQLCFAPFMLGLLNLFLPAVDCLCSPRDSFALLALKDESQSGALSSWRPGSDCCRGWAGVTCDASGTDVIELNLTGDLQLGSDNVHISSGLCNLYELQVVKLSFMDGAGEGNLVGRQLPACIWNMAEIRSLTVDTNEGVAFLGPLPAEVCTRTHLRHLQVPIEGEIPDCVWGMTKLNFLDLGAANPSQSFSSQVCNLKNLTHLAVGKYQEIDGTPVEVAARLAIPDCIWSMTGLEYLRLSGFTLPSSISSDVCNLVNLAYFDVGFSSLYGEIPQCIWSLANLKHLGVWGQGSAFPAAFRGNFSSDICNLQNLSYLSIMGLTLVDGYIPACIWNLTGLEVLVLEGYQLPGLFSSQMCKLTRLQELQIPFNDFTGAWSAALPACFWNMTQLKFVDLTGLDLSNMEHPYQVFAPSLRQLYIGSTNVTGDLLDAIGNFSALRELDISANGITFLPDGIQNLHDLYHLDADRNMISTIPAWFGGLQSLSYLNLSQNTVTSLRSLSGSSVLPQNDIDMPSVFSNLSRLESLDLSSNFITNLPPCLLNLSRLSYVDLAANHLESVFLSRQSRSNPCNVSLASNLIQNITLEGPGIYSLDLSANLLNSSSAIQLNLSGVTTLNLEKNHLRSLPTGMSHSSDLQSLALSLNLLKTVPSFVSQATNLKMLYLGNNQLRDVWGVCPLEKVVLLNLGNNYLGSSQAGVSSLACVKNMTRMSKLRLRNNTIPGDLTALLSTMICNLTELTFFDLFRNNITGNLSSFPGDFPKLTTFHVSQNQLSGELPASLFSPAAAAGPWTTTGRYYNASTNHLVGRLPEIQGDGWQLDLSYNNLEGSLPNFSDCSFDALVLAGNMFTGSIPTGLQSSTAGLKALDLSFNNFTGSIPTYFGDMRSLMALDLTSNNLESSLPESLGNCWNLQHLRVNNNSLRGQIPTSIGKAGSLRFVAMANNSLSGSIPASLGESVRLKFLDLSRNNLTGTVPDSFRKLSSCLRALIVSSNRLSGPFPPWIVTDNFTFLQWLDLSNNTFHGPLPSNFSQLHGFSNGSMTGNNDTIAETVPLSAKGDRLNIPYLTTLRTSLDVCSNYFSGEIPSQLGELVALRYLSLASNLFSAKIPPELANLQELESLDLSNNDLNGTIPEGLGGIPRLSYFNASYNSLTGPIPGGTQFEGFRPEVFRNNSGLCSYSGIPLPLCKNGTSGTSPVDPVVEGHSGERHFSQWVSLEAFYMGFGMAFFVVTVTMIVSGSARNCLLPPRRQLKWRFDYSHPYGAYNPRS